MSKSTDSASKISQFSTAVVDDTSVTVSWIPASAGCSYKVQLTHPFNSPINQETTTESTSHKFTGLISFLTTFKTIDKVQFTYQFCLKLLFINFLVFIKVYSVLSKQNLYAK